MALRITRSMKSECVPFWDEKSGGWVIELDESLECSELLHELMHRETGECYCSCTAGHNSKVRITFRRGAYRQGLRPWRDSCRLLVDDVMDVVVDVNAIMSLLAKPTNPQGDGKAASEASGSNKQQMAVKKTTVIRV